MATSMSLAYSSFLDAAKIKEGFVVASCGLYLSIAEELVSLYPYVTFQRGIPGGGPVRKWPAASRTGKIPYELSQLNALTLERFPPELTGIADNGLSGRAKAHALARAGISE